MLCEPVASLTPPPPDVRGISSTIRAAIRSKQASVSCFSLQTGEATPTRSALIVS